MNQIENRKDDNYKENLTSEILPTSNLVVDTTVTRKYSELISEEDFFLTSPLMSTLSGQYYYDYLSNIKRFTTNVTEEIKNRYPGRGCP